MIVLREVESLYFYIKCDIEISNDLKVNFLRFMFSNIFFLERILI